MTFPLGPALLFCPADRPERLGRALDRADAVIADLEDAVAGDRKVAARGALIDARLDPERVIVRVNPVQSELFEADMATLSQTDFRRIMVPKAESVKRVGRIDARFEVAVLCETARGVVNAERFAALENVHALMWGAEDLVASLGGTASRTRAGAYRDVARHARSRVLLAAGARRKAAIDAVHLDIDDLDGLRHEAEDAAASGFAASACIHPRQVPVIRDAYRPAADDLAWARGVLEAASGTGGVFTYAGRMVDEPVLEHARALERRAR